jgi:branched-chain amino acid transport system substrate-binding protein
MTPAERNHEYRFYRRTTTWRTCGDNLGVRPITGAMAWLSLLSLVVLAACSGGGAAGKTIKIGVDLPLSGIEGQGGTPTLNGIRFYVHQHPVLDGYTVVISALDDAVNGVHNPKRGADNVAALVADPLVIGVIGPLDSSVARATIPIANKANLAMISPSASNRCLTTEPFLPAAANPLRVAISCKSAGFPSPTDLRPTATNSFFRLAATDDLQGAAAADFGYKNLHLLRVAVLSDHEVYGQGLADSFRARFTKLGGLVVSYLDLAPSGTFDLSAFFKQAKGDGAQAIYFGGSTANKGCVIRAQMATVFGSGAAIPYIGGDGIAEDPACVRDAGTNAAGVYGTVPIADPSHDPASQAAIAAFKSEYSHPWNFGAYTMAAYDATAILYDAIHRANEDAGGKLPSRRIVADDVALIGTGANPRFGFVPTGDTSHPVISIYEAQGSDPAAPWPWVGAIDYSAKLPY